MDTSKHETCARALTRATGIQCKALPGGRYKVGWGIAPSLRAATCLAARMAAQLDHEMADLEG